MANIKYSSVVADARGKIGGVVYSRNRGGSYARTFTAPVQPRTPRQTAVRAILATYSSMWGSLTQAQRDSFIVAADNSPQTNKLGESFRLSGHQLFVKINSFMASVNSAGGAILGSLVLNPVLSAPPVVALAPLVPEGSIFESIPGTPAWSNVGATFSAPWSEGGIIPEDTFVLLEITPPYPPGRSYVSPSNYRRVYLYSNATNVGNLDIQDTLNDLEIAAVQGWKMRLRYTAFTSGGQISPPVVVEGIIT